MGAELSEPFIMMFAKAVIKFIFLVWIFIFSLVVGIEVSSERQSSLSKKLASETFLWGNCLPIMKNETQSSLRRYTASVPREASEKQQCLLQAAGTKGGQWATQSDGHLNDYPCSYYMRQHKETGFLGSASALSCWCFSHHLHGLLGWEVAQKTWANPRTHEGDMVTCLFVPVSLQRTRGKLRIRYPHHWCGHRPLWHRHRHDVRGSFTKLLCFSATTSVGTKDTPTTGRSISQMHIWFSVCVD